MSFLRSVQLQGILSFSPDSDEVALSSLNVMIGPNGSGKSNLIAALGLLAWTPTSFSAAIREGGGVAEWHWKGGNHPGVGSIEAGFDWNRSNLQPVHRIKFMTVGTRAEVVEESIEETVGNPPKKFYRLQNGLAEIATRNVIVDHDARLQMVNRELRSIDRATLNVYESILSQRKDPELYPELTDLGRRYSRIQFFQDWCFGRSAEVRRPQPVDLPSDVLLPDCSNLGLFLNHLEHHGAYQELNRRLTQFLPRFQKVSGRVIRSTIQVFLHEGGLTAPIPATRISDGTLRFIALLAVLLSPNPPPLVCIEEPELGLHPDAIAILAEVMVEAQERMQLIVTTHSDALVSALSDHSESVLVCEHHGGTVMKRVEPGLVQHWLEKYRLGEVWRMGALGGNP